MKEARKVNRGERGQSVVIMVILCLLSALWLAGMFGAILPSYQRVGIVRANNLARGGAECGLDWAVDQMSNSATRPNIDVVFQNGQPATPNPRVSSVPASVLPAGVASATCSVTAINCPSTSATYQASLDNTNASNGLTNGPLWRVVRVTSTLTSGKTKTVQAVFQPYLPPGNPWTYAMASFTTMNGNTPSTPIHTYSYNSTNGGNPQTTKVNTGGDIGANGSINLGNMKVGGNVHTYGASGGNVTGSKASVQQTIIASGTVSNAVVGTGGGNNVQINVLNSTGAANPIQQNISSAPIQMFPIPAHAGAAQLPSSGSVGAGNYTVNQLSNQNLTVSSGPVNIFVEGPSASIQWTGNITVTSGHPADLRIFYSGSQDVALDNGHTLTAVVYAPNAMVHFDNGGKLFGSVVAGSLVLDNGSEFYYDQALANLSISGNGLTYSTSSYQEF